LIEQQRLAEEARKIIEKEARVMEERRVAEEQRLAEEHRQSEMWFTEQVKVEDYNNQPEKMYKEVETWENGVLDIQFVDMGQSSESDPSSSIPFVSPVNSESNLAFTAPEPKPKSTEEMWQSVSLTKVQGGSIKTCSLSEDIQRVEVFLRTDGRPLNANVELWSGPDNIPQKTSVYVEDGLTRSFRATIECFGSSNAIAIRNTGPMELPLTAGIEADYADKDISENPTNFIPKADPKLLQGGAVYTKSFSGGVKSVQIMLESNGRPLNAKIELLQGPNNGKQIMEIYSDNGTLRPFYAIVDTPGTGNVVKIVNTGTIEFPLSAFVEPYIVDDDYKPPDEGPSRKGYIWT